MLKKRVLRGIFGTEWEEVTGDFRKLQNESCSTFCTAQLAFFKGN